jgi:hypothetical protein
LAEKKGTRAGIRNVGRVMPLRDGHGVIRDAVKALPTDELRLDFLRALAELEDNECHRTRSFPRTRLHKVVGIKWSVYRADVDKVSGWRIHLQYGKDGELQLRDIVPRQKHDDVIQVIQGKAERYDL